MGDQTMATLDDADSASFVRRMVFVGPASDRNFVPECQACGLDWACHGDILELILLGSWSLLGLPGPATDTILHFQFAILPVYAGPAAAMDGISCSFLSSRLLNE